MIIIIYFICLIVFGLSQSQIVLDQNQLSEWTDNYASATSIVLEYKDISFIDTATFAGLTNLQSLVLHWNKLTFIDSLTFKDLINLKSLNIGGNQLISLNSQIFKYVKSLTYLGIGTTLISNLDSGLFDSLTNLHRINKASNCLLRCKTNQHYTAEFCY